MIMNNDVIKALSAKEETKELADLRQRLQDLVKMSRDTMKDYYDMWDQNDKVYRGERTLDAADVKAVKRNEPAKVYVPMTHTQVQTFVSFASMILTQRDYFFELDGSGAEDIRPAKLAQATVQRDLEYNKFEGVLLEQFLTDIGRFGLGVIKSSWKRDTVPVAQQVPDPQFVPQPGLPAQMAPPMVTQWVDKTKYLGNAIEVISPYRWFPDTRLPITKYRDGEFCADETEYSMTRLRELEKQGEIAGLTWIPKLPDDVFSDRRFSGINEETNQRFDPTVSAKDASHYVLITEVAIRLNPSETLVAPNTPINPDINTDVICLVWIANDGRIVRVVDSGYQHNEFLYDCAQFFNDQNRLINHGIVELLAPMQDILDWLMNARVTNVRKVIQNQLIVDPKNIEMEDLKERRPVIRLKSTVPEGTSIDQYIKQLQVVDVTSGHLNDMAVIQEFSQQATGLQDNLMGQYSQGRRSAREASNVNANASARVILPIRSIWEAALLPLGRKLLSNLQQGLDEEQLVRVVGLSRYLLDSQPDPMTGISPVQSFLPVDRSSLVGNYDFLFFEGTLPSQRMAIAASIAQAGEIILKGGPQALFALQLDPKLLFEEWLTLQGIRNVERFRLTPQRVGEIMGLAQVARNGMGPGTPPGQGAAGPGAGQQIPAGV